jgi:hypothetical protein
LVGVTGPAPFEARNTPAANQQEFARWSAEKQATVDAMSVAHAVVAAAGASDDADADNIWADAEIQAKLVLAQTRNFSNEVQNQAEAVIKPNTEPKHSRTSSKAISVSNHDNTGLTQAHAQRATGRPTQYICGYCGILRTSLAGVSNDRVQIFCSCGGVKKDNIPRVHARWVEYNDGNELSINVPPNIVWSTPNVPHITTSQPGNSVSAAACAGQPDLGLC